MSDLELFVANVNALIEADGLSVSELARRAKVDRAELSQLLNGHTDATLTRASKIARALGVSLDSLVGKHVAALAS